ncbi:MAG: alcohol dehydrogenase catalytic domain-containing protein, partial [Bdellovibrionales bacterium]|nr:alcohol dehydrogenase catalytic domain-containing protein [Bdellovibrionales bacterium]
MKSYQEIQITKHGAADVLKIHPFELSDPKENEVQIEVKGAGINFADIMMRQGLYPEAPKPPFVPGYEVSGKVLKVGPKVTKYRPGDRVMAACRFGGYTQGINVHELLVRKLPDGISFEAGAAIPVNYLTAWVGL